MVCDNIECKVKLGVRDVNLCVKYKLIFDIMKHLMWDPEVLISQPNNVCIFLRKKNQLGWTHKKNHIFTLPQFSTLLSYYEYVLFADDLIVCLETPEGLQKLIYFYTLKHFRLTYKDTNCAIFLLVNRMVFF